MVARRLVLGVMASMCWLASVLAVSPVSVSAATRFGSYGNEAEQLHAPIGVAVDATGDVYVGDSENDRVDKFDSAGNWLLAWGTGVSTDEGEIDGEGEIQTCTTDCRNGSQGDRDSFEVNTGVAVDDDPLSSSYGDVYVVDQGLQKIEKLDPSGNFILMFGGHVNEEASPQNPDVCVAGEKCKVYATTGTANGEFELWPPYCSIIAVGPLGDVYVGDEGRIEVFESSGAWKENITLAGLSSTGRPTALAVDSTGDIFIKDEGIAGVHELEPNGTEKTTEFDATSTTVTSLALGTSGRVYVGDSNGGFHVLEYDSSGKELASFGMNTVTGTNGGLAFSSTTEMLYAAEAHTNYGEAPQSSIWVLAPPVAGPLIDSESATPELRGAAGIKALVNPEGNETTYRFEYVDDAHFQVSGYAGAASTAPVSIGSSFDDQEASTSFTPGSLTPGVVYHYRVRATDSLGHTSVGSDQSFQEIPPAIIGAPWVTNVAGTSATIEAMIDPLGARTSYRIEYGATTAYGHTIYGDVGDGNEFVPIANHVQELEPVTTYHYKVVTTNEVGTWESADLTFTTQTATGQLTLLDDRSWELVSPVNKHGALIEPEPVGVVQAASDGSGLAYGASFPVTANAPARANFLGVQVLARRGPGGWSSEELGTTEALSEKENEKFQPRAEAIFPTFFSNDLSSTMMEPGFNAAKSLSPEASERTLYIRDNTNGEYTPVVRPANVPAGTKYGGEGIGTYKGSEQEMRFLMASPDLSHVVLESPIRLTPEALEESQVAGCQAQVTNDCPQNLYEWSGGQLALVSILPNGEPQREAFLGRGSEDVIHAISNDGQRIVWAAGSLYKNHLNTMYVRDMAQGRTLQFGGPTARYETMSGDGSRVFYWEKSELYVFAFATDTTTDLTATYAAGEHNADVKDGFILTASEDGTYVYYVATGALAPGAVSGEDNLYASHYDGSHWTNTLIATLSKSDEFVKEVDPLSPLVFWQFMDAEASSNGRYLAFMSNGSLTGYDNHDAVSGQPDEEVYLYDAVDHSLVCASCDPSGARPLGIDIGLGEGPLVDRDGGNWEGDWIAANLPNGDINEGPLQVPPSPALSQRHYLSNSGRLFFDSSDALVPQDTNGLNDVYEYEPAGVGSCSGSDTTFSRLSGGCVDLISAGTSAGESAFMDASENGDDVFFVTASKLVEEDVDSENDVYDAHVCSEQVPCRSTPVLPPPCTSGDSCKAAPAPQPEIFGPAPSATFSGTGNVAALPGAGGIAPRSLTQAQKLAKALRACGRLRTKKKRVACERLARKRYPAKQRRKANASKKGKG